jgi:hypothetical protein
MLHNRRLMLEDVIEEVGQGVRDRGVGVCADLSMGLD